MIRSFGRVGNPRMSGVDHTVSTDTAHAPVTDAHHYPVNVVSHVFDEGSSVAVFQSLEDFANTVGCSGPLEISFHLRSISGYCQSANRPAVDFHC